VSFSYFDTGSRSYKPLRTQEPPLRVPAGAPARLAAGLTAALTVKLPMAPL